VRLQRFDGPDFIAARWLECETIDDGYSRLVPLFGEHVELTLGDKEGFRVTWLIRVAKSHLAPVRQRCIALYGIRLRQLEDVQALTNCVVVADVRDVETVLICLLDAGRQRDVFPILRFNAFQ